MHLNLYLLYHYTYIYKLFSHEGYYSGLRNLWFVAAIREGFRMCNYFSVDRRGLLNCEGRSLKKYDLACIQIFSHMTLV